MLLVIQIQEELKRKLNDLKPSFSRNKERQVSREVKDHVLASRGPNLPTRNTGNKTHRKSICVSWTSGKNHICSIKTKNPPKHNLPARRKKSWNNQQHFKHFWLSFVSFHKRTSPHGFLELAEGNRIWVLLGQIIAYHRLASSNANFNFASTLTSCGNVDACKFHSKRSCSIFKSCHYNILHCLSSCVELMTFQTID